MASDYKVCKDSKDHCNTCPANEEESLGQLEKDTRNSDKNDEGYHRCNSNYVCFLVLHQSFILVSE